MDFSTHLGYVIRQHCPVRVKRFSDLTDEDFLHLYPYVEDKFDVHVLEDETVMHCILSIWGEQFRNYRHAMYKHFQSFRNLEEARAHPYRRISKEDWEWVCDNVFTDEKWKILARSEMNAKNISKLTIRHSTGQKSFLRAREEMKELDQIEFFRSTHYREGRGWTTHGAEEAYDQMVTLITEAESLGTSLTHSAAVSQVLGTRSGYVKGMGHGEPSMSSSNRGRLKSSSSQRIVMEEFEETKRELQETKGELAETNGELGRTKDELANTKEELANMKDQFNVMSSEFQEIRSLLLRPGNVHLTSSHP